MGRIDPERIRNVALLGHSHDGKTSLAEAMLYAGGAVDRLGRPDAGNTTFDFEPEEVKRKISIGTAVAHLTWHDHKINLLDAPGFQDFAGEVVGALRAAEGALLVVGATTGVVVGTELGWQQCRDRNLPTLIVVNKMDKENADYWRAVDSFKEFNPRPVSIQAPIGHEAGFKGIVDLLTRKAYEFDQQGHAKEVPLPGDLAADVESRRSPLVEAAAETDDALLEKYLESGELTHRSTRQRRGRRCDRAGIMRGGRQVDRHRHAARCHRHAAALTQAGPIGRGGQSAYRADRNGDCRPGSAAGSARLQDHR
jgi:elongation factor G